MTTLSVQLFGIPQITTTNAVIQIGRRKALALFIYLVLNQTSQSRVRLASLLWDAETGTKTNNYLRLLIHEVKQALGENTLHVDESRLAIADTVAIEVDALRFHDLVHASHNSSAHDRINTLNAALELYQADLLADFSIPDAPAFERWLNLQRNRFHELLVQAYDELVAAYLLVGELAEGLKVAQNWLLKEPHSESAYRALMQVHYSAGRRSVALNYYQQLSDMLEREYGLSPMPRTQALHNLIRRADSDLETVYSAIDNILSQKVEHHETVIQRQQILSDAKFMKLRNKYPDLQSIQIEINEETAIIRFQSLIASDDAKAHNIPQHPAPFVGRERELAEIGEIIRLPSNRLVTILGLGGLGKTRLAQELGIELAGKFEAGVTFVALEHAQSEDDIFYAISDSLALDMPHIRSAAREEVLRSLKQGQRLLILDNYEHLVVHSHIVRQFLEESSELKILVTSRERLNIDGEQVYYLGGLHYPDKDSSVALGDYESVRLFLERLRRVRPRKSVTSSELREIAMICRLVQGVPLGIVIAAAWGNMLQLREIQDQIQRSLDFLQIEQRDMPSRHRSIRAIFDSSWILLNESERETLLRLSVFRGGFTHEAAAQVCNASLHTLNLIINKSLLNYDELNKRFTLHPLIQQFAEARLAQHDGETLIRYAHCRYYLDLIRTTDDVYNQKSQEALHQTITSEIENIRAAWHFAAKMRDYELLHDAIGVLSLYHATRGLWSEAFALFEAARVQMAPKQGETAHPTWGRLLTHHYGSVQHHGGVEQRLAFLQRGLDILQDTALAFETAHALTEIGVASILAERYERAIPYFLQVIDFHEQENLEHALAHSYWYLALCYVSIGQYDEAISYNEKSYGIKLKLNDRRGISDCLNMKASLAFAFGDFDDVPNLLEQARTIGQEIDNRTGVMFSSLALACYWLLYGNRKQAKQLAEFGLDIAEMVANNDEGQGAALALLAVLAFLDKNTENAKEYMNRAWATIQEQAPETSTESVNLGITLTLNWALLFLGLSFAQSEIVKPCLAKVREIAIRTKSLGIQMMCLPLLAVYFADNDSEHSRYFITLSQQVPTIAGWSKDWSLFASLPASEKEPKIDLNSYTLLTALQDF